MPSKQDDLARLLQIMAPGAADVVAMIEAYFDESEAQDDREFLAVAGYIFEKNRCLGLDADWATMLEEAGKPGPPLPYFRMSSCAHRNQPWDRVSQPDCDKAARAAIAAIKKHMTMGFCTAIRQTDYAAWMPDHNTVGTAYVWCCWMSLVGVRLWADSVGFNGKIAYFFEAGHKHERAANAVMNRIFKSPNFRAAYRYGSHGFVPKESSRALQAADLLAWHTVQDYKRAKIAERQRKDFEALLNGQASQYRFVGGQKDMFDALVDLADFAIFLRGLDL